ncbi:MAG TPA: sodium/solute symporter [Acidobacteriaceae bacterium]|jgi:SSS family solute:Na+ symporter|nr:sodium/solute symporter [Acidobacteriaceae bacterium]
MHATVANSFDIAIVCAYFALTLLIGYRSRRNATNSAQYLNATRAMPMWVAALSFLAVNLSGMEMIGFSALSAEYGVSALHFYWIGAIPAMIFLALFMVPIYLRSRAQSVPEFLHLRFNSQTRLLNCISMLVASALLAGISLYAMALTLCSFFGWNFFAGTLVGGLLTLIYLILGGLRATIYNELLQLTIVLAGLVPLAILILTASHGIHGLLAPLPVASQHLWREMPLTSHTAPLDQIGVAMGLGFVLSFGYWCTDFRLIQRTLTAQQGREVRMVPLIAAAGKMFVPLLVIVPGLAAFTLLAHAGQEGKLPNYNQALPWMISRYYGHGLFGLGLAAMLAGLISGVAGNVAAFSSLWTQEIYRPYLAQARTEKHYILIGKSSMAVGVILSIAAAFIALRFKNLMDYVQLLFSLFNAPLFAVFLLGMFTRWATPWAGFWGLLIGVFIGIAHQAAVRVGMLSYGSQMSANFYGAIYAWLVSILSIAAISRWTVARDTAEFDGLVCRFEFLSGISRRTRPVFTLALLLAAVCLLLNFWFR